MVDGWMSFVQCCGYLSALLHVRCSYTVIIQFFYQELAAEISVLEKQRDELEAQLKKVFYPPNLVNYGKFYNEITYIIVF